MTLPGPVGARSPWWPALIGSGCLLLVLTAAIGVVHVDPDGSVSQEYGSASPYTTTTGGHQLRITVAGTVRGTIRTSDGVITFRGMSADGTVTAVVDGTAVTTVPLQAGTDPVRYSCSDNTVTETGPQNYSVTLTRASA